MEVIRFARALVPLAAITLMGAPGVARPAVPGAADPPWDPPACRGAVTAPTGLGGDGLVPHGRRAGRVGDARGPAADHRRRRRAASGRSRCPPSRSRPGPCAASSWSAMTTGPRSRLRVVDPARGCAWTIATEPAVIRSAIFATDGGSTWEHRVDRATRADLGVWRRPVGGGTASRVAPGLAPDVAHGRTFATDLRWAPDGRLVVASCGELACRTRLVDPGDRPRRVDERHRTRHRRRRRRASSPTTSCPGFPCAVEATDPSTGVGERSSTRRARPWSRAARWCSSMTATSRGSTCATRAIVGRRRRPTGSRPSATAPARPPAWTCRLAPCCSRPPGNAPAPVDREATRPRHHRHPADRGGAAMISRLHAVAAHRARGASHPRFAGGAVRRRARPGPDPRRRAVRAEPRPHLSLGRRRDAAGGDEGARSRTPRTTRTPPASRRRRRSTTTPPRGTSCTTGRTCRAASTASPACAGTHPTGSASGSARTATGSTGARSAGASCRAGPMAATRSRT